MSFGSYLKQSLKNQLGSWDEFTDGFKEGFFGTDNLRDYQHASKTFRSDGFALAPNQKFLFHVYFTLNTAEIPNLSKAMGGAEGVSRIGTLVKTVQLPSYEIQTRDLNQYNRKRYTQERIFYKPVTLTLHDDGSDTIRSMWFNYFNYYYRDADYGYDTDGTDLPDYNKRDVYENERNENDWGFSGRGPNGYNKPNFFKDIKIYGLNRGNFVSYTLINPIITDFQHDTYDYTQTNGVMQNSMTIKYELVKYNRGKVGGKVYGFGDSAYYDTTPSPLRAGTKATLFGQGGILDAGNNILEDLASGNILGAIRTGGSLRNALKGKDIKGIVSDELVSSAISSGLNFLSNNGSRSGSLFSIPSFGSNLNFGSFGDSISSTASTLFGGSSFDSITGDLGKSLSNTFGSVSNSVNALKNQFAPGTELNSDYMGFFNSLKSSLEPGMSIVENTFSEVTQSIDTSNFPSITNLVDDIPGQDSLKQTLNNITPELQTVAKSFAPVGDAITNSFNDALNTNESREFINKFSKTVGTVFSNGQDIGN